MSPLRASWPVRKARPLNAKQLTALQARMVRAIQVDLARGIRRLKAGVSTAQFERAVRSRQYARVTEMVPFDALADAWQQAQDKLRSVAGKAAEAARATLPRNIESLLRYDVANPRIDGYVKMRIGSLIQGIRDETHANVTAQVRAALQQGRTVPQVARRIRDGLGLNNRQAQALANYDGPDPSAYAEQLQSQRADMVARTEVAYANNQGQLDVWAAAAEQDLLPDGAMRQLVTDYDPCPKICRPLEGQQIGLDEEWQLSDGTTAPSPPLHPACFCREVLVWDGYTPDVSRGGLVD